MGAPDPPYDGPTTTDATTTGDAPAAGPIPVTPPKPGWQTTEFWTALAPLAVFVVAMFTHRQIDTGTAGAILAGVGTVAAGGYAVYRQILKATHVKAAAQVHSDALASMPTTLTIEPSDIDAITAGVAARLLTGPATVRQTPFRKPAKRPPARATAAPARRKKTASR